VAFGFDLGWDGAVRVEAEDLDAARHGILLGQIETRRTRRAAGKLRASEHEHE
jgi:hypothetical protein